MVVLVRVLPKAQRCSIAGVSVNNARKLHFEGRMPSTKRNILDSNRLRDHLRRHSKERVSQSLIHTMYPAIHPSTLSPKVLVGPRSAKSNDLCGFPIALASGRTMSISRSGAPTMFRLIFENNHLRPPSDSTNECDISASPEHRRNIVGHVSPGSFLCCSDKVGLSCFFGSGSAFEMLDFFEAPQPPLIV